MITYKVECGGFKIYINNILHLFILIPNLSGVQSWRENNCYYIEYTFKEGESIVSEYTYDNWVTVLELIDTLSVLNK